MWRPVDLRFDHNMMKSGEFDKVPATEIRNIIDSHKAEFEKVKGHMPGNLMGECLESLDALEGYYKLRLSKGSKGRSRKPAPKGQNIKRKSPTERYKELFGSPPTEDYRKLFGSFDKKGYSKWLSQQVKATEDKAK